MDIDGNGMIDLEEFCLCMAKHLAKKSQSSSHSRTQLTNRQLKDAFDFFDKVCFYMLSLSLECFPHSNYIFILFRIRNSFCVDTLYRIEDLKNIRSLMRADRYQSFVLISKTLFCTLYNLHISIRNRE